MARDMAYRKAEKKIEEAQRSSATKLDLSGMKLAELPESFSTLTQLQWLILKGNKLTVLPESLGVLKQLRVLELDRNKLTVLPESLGALKHLKVLDLDHNELAVLPESLGALKQLEWLDLGCNRLTALPKSLCALWRLNMLNLSDNRLNPELAEVYKEGLNAVRRYLRAQAQAQITLNEAKLILVGEGEVGKTCLMDALLDKPWKEHDTTHGIEIKPVIATDPKSKKVITLNGWDFGGQRVYRPTHQLFFSAPAIYLVVWKPREGPQQGFVKDWIQLIKRREPSAKILVVATHGGPQQRQPDIDRQELWDLFGKETVIDFFHVESKPDEQGKRRGIEKLRDAIARLAATLPEVGRQVPTSFKEVRDALQKSGEPYLPLKRVLSICRSFKMDKELASLFVTIEHRLGHLIHYEHNSVLSNIVVLKPDWLATAISFVLDDKTTRDAHGLVRLSRLSKLWDDPTRAAEFRYPATLHRIFLGLMEKYDLSYRVAEPSPKRDSDPQSLIAQLVPDIRPENIENFWYSANFTGDSQQTQICRIVDRQDGQSASAEGLFYQLIVRLHKYSLGRVNYNYSVHWQRGLVLDDAYNGRALLEHIGNDMRITVRASYPERFLAMLTAEVKYLVESFWEGLRCDVMVPCINPCGKGNAGIGLFEVEKLITFKRQGMVKFPCIVSGCNQAQDIDALLRNAPTATRHISLDELLVQFAAIKNKLDSVDANTRRVLSKIDDAYSGLIQIFTDEAKEGPRLFDLVPVERNKFNPETWVRAKFCVRLWCEHARLPLNSPYLNGKGSKKGVYEIELEREWFKRVAPYLKVVVGTLSLVLPVASSAIKLPLDKSTYEAIEEQLDFGKSVIDAAVSGGTKSGEWMGAPDTTSLKPDKARPAFEATRAHSAVLRELHALLKAKDPSFGGLVRVMNKRQEFLWVHEKFAGEY